jgi:hypothetical protein
VSTKPLPEKAVVVVAAAVGATAVVAAIVVAVDMAAMAVVAATAGKASPISPYCKLSSSALSDTNPAVDAPRQGYFVQSVQR